MSTLPLKPVVDAYYNLQAISTPRSGFNLGAIVGTTLIDEAVLPDTIYNSVDEMIEAGYALTNPEVLAAQVYFAASSQPGQLYVHTWVKSATKAYKKYKNGPLSYGNTVTVGEMTYTLGDGTSGTTTFTALTTALTNAGATTATFTQGSTASAGTLDVVLPSSGAGSSATTIAFTVDKGTGSDVDEVESYAGLDAETAAATVQAMRTANSEWYAVAFVDTLQASDIKEVAAYIESSSIYSTFFFNNSDADVLSNTDNNLFAQLKALGYKRTCGVATTQPYTHIGAMAYAMGQISDKANSSFTLGLKSLTGCIVDSFTSTQVNNVEGNNGNVYINRGSYYNFFEKGKVFSGAWYDEIIQLDKLVNNIQLDIADLLYQNPKIPQTEGGVSRLMAKIAESCKNAVKTGFIAPGQWNGGDVLNLASGDYLPDGYLIQAESIDSQSQADRDARKCPNIYVAVKLAGAIQSVTIQVDVNR